VLAAHKKWKLYTQDDRSTFLHGKVGQNVYVEQPNVYLKYLV